MQQIAGYDIVQVAYYVRDIEASAKTAAKTFGAGPFVVSKHIQLSKGIHRGEPCPFVHSSAYGQWGSIMLELVQQEGEGASPFRDLYVETEQGLHHVAIMVPDFEAALAHFAQLGITRVTEAVTLTGVEFAFLDARETLGHYLEIYEASAALRRFYRFVADAAQAPWNPDEPFITRT